jgi:cytochrome c553
MNISRVSSLAPRLSVGLVLCLVVATGASRVTLRGQDPARAANDEFQQTVLPVISKNCLGCHSDRVHTGGLSLEVFKNDPSLVMQKHDVWVKVLDKVKAGTMPPRSSAPLSPQDIASVTGWIERTFGAASAAEAGDGRIDPGRVTARRLNRAEYNNTIRDLLGVTLRPADEFPIDDSGYGFDNIGDVLSMSPMLMEKYMSAARSVSRAAVFGESYPEKPTLLVRLMPKKIQDDMQATGNVTPFSARGALFTTFHAPVEGEYEFRFRHQNYRGGEQVVQGDGPGARGARGAGGATGAGAPAAVAPIAPVAPVAPAAPGSSPGRGAGPRRPPTDEERAARYERACAGAPPETLVFNIDGVQHFTYSVRGTTDCEYSRGENIVRAKLTAGDHVLRASFPGLANMADVRTNFNPDGRRRLYVDYMDVLGVYNPTAAPPPGYGQIFICSEKSAECARKIIENLAMRAYRRPATAQEINRLVTLASEVRRRDSFEESIRVAVQAVLMSPNFLFRIEKDPGPKGATATVGSAGAASAYPISEYELASRLSYFLWSSMPDDQLFRLAADKRLRDGGVLDAQVKRMLADPKAETLARNFGEQWLNLRLMDRKKPDAARFSAVDDELLDAMRQETLLFIDEIVRKDRSILDFIDGRFTYLNGPLARFYGVPGIDGEAFTRVELDGEQRSGIVTHGSVLSISSYATRTSPVIRGKWVLENLLGSAPPPPPDNIPALQEADLGTAASMRQRLEQHRADPSCAACHNSMDPIGFGLENYDAAGAWRTKDGNFDVDSSGTLPDGRSFTGAKGLKQVLMSQSHAFTQNFTEKLLTYALGRGIERSDRALVGQISGKVAQQNYRFSALVSSIVNSPAFQMRSVSSGDTTP